MAIIKTIVMNSLLLISILCSDAVVAGREAPINNEVSDKSNGDYSSNWSGAVLNAPPSGTTFTSVSAEFSVPTPGVADNEAGSSAAWVGIDGNTYQNAILQTGIDLSVNADGSASFDAWYEWYPAYAYDFSDISINAGDNVSLSVVSTSPNSGIATIENLTNGQKASQILTAPDSSSTLGGQNAEWIVEDYEVGSSLVTLDNFGIVTFTNASAGLSNGTSVGIDSADVINMIQNESGQESEGTTPGDDRIKLGY
ncbi:putative aspergillopepsin-2 precursor [Talaromyces proteolyticus]|uniref:Aspergillopepsin-2 n=1 Tax=Talaromyces proteolyticus TaxID=1131652 RepID=A0AAD4KHD1_9EURO|nr:putative aspergillopepsin-2 precursor [Talaromyces proteolyticus]KAH8691830.1 putative aspergillopepsin-2 precursor [Talaromyces proteolyticus]